MLGKALKRIGIGFSLGMSIGNLITALTSPSDVIVAPELLERIGNVTGAFLWQSFLSGVIGGVAFACVGYFEMKHWPLWMAESAHYATCLAVFLPVAFFLCWLETAADALIMAVILLVLDLIIFFVLWEHYRSQVKEANKLIEQRKKKQMKDNKTGGTG